MLPMVCGEQIQLFRRCQNIGQIDIMSADDALDSVDRSIDAVYLAAGHAAFHNTRYGRVDRAEGPPDCAISMCFML